MTGRDRTEHGDLRMSVSMPSIEVGTVGGGTVLEPQGAMLDLIGVRGSNNGQNAIDLAKAVAAGVLAGELSLCSALTVGALVESRKYIFPSLGSPILYEYGKSSD